jgi:two-component system sensor kinase FixL
MNKSGLTDAQAMMAQLMEIARVSALTELASGIAHEINQPLGAIATFSKAAERMLDRPNPMVPQAIDVLRQITHEALGAGEGIRRIRRLFDRDENPRTQCRMGDLLAELEPALEALTVQINGRLEIECPAEVPCIPVDRLRIQHVILALMQNACDASSLAEAPVIRLQCRSDRYTVEIGVSDSGTGIPAGMEDQIFKPFFTTKSRGTGLGLASSRAIVEAHGGKIGFDPRPNGGTRFWFQLPVV